MNWIKTNFKKIFLNKYFYLGIIFLSICLVYLSLIRVDNSFFIYQNNSKLGILPNNIYPNKISSADYKLFKDEKCYIHKYAFFSTEEGKSLSINFPKNEKNIYYYFEAPYVYVQNKFINVPENGIIDINPNIKNFTLWIITKNTLSLKEGYIQENNNTKYVNDNVYVLKNNTEFRQNKQLLANSRQLLFPEYTQVLLDSYLIQLLIFLFFIIGIIFLISKIKALIKKRKEYIIQIKTTINSRKKILKFSSIIIFTVIPTIYFYKTLFIREKIEVVLTNSLTIPKFRIIETNNPNSYYEEPPLIQEENNSDFERKPLTAKTMSDLVENGNDIVGMKVSISSSIELFENIAVSGILTGPSNIKSISNFNHLLNYKIINNSNKSLTEIQIKSKNDQLKYLKFNDNIIEINESYNLNQILEPNTEIDFQIYSENDDVIKIYSDEYYSIQDNYLIDITTTSKFDYLISKLVYNSLAFQLIILTLSLFGIFSFLRRTIILTKKVLKITAPNTV